MKQIFEHKNFTNIYLPLLLMLLNLVVKGIYLDSRSIFHDEPFTIYHAQMDIGQIIAQLSQGNNPPLYEILLHYWIQLFGIEAFSVRFLPLIFNVLTVLMVYKLGLKFFNINVAIVAACLVIFSNYHIYYTHETRVYPLFMLLTTSSMYSFLSIQKKSEDKKHLIFLIINNLLLIYAHFFGFFILIIQGLAVVLIPVFRNTILKKYLIGLSFVFVGYLPYISILAGRFLESSSNGTWVQPPSGLSDLYNMLWRFSNMPVTTVVYIAILVLGLTKYIINRKTASVTPEHSLVILWFIFPFLTMYIVSYKVPIFSERYLAFVTVGYYLCIAIAGDALFAATKFKMAVSALIIILMLATSNPNFDFQKDTENAILYVKNAKKLKKDKFVYFAPGWFDMNFVYYYDRAWFMDYDAINIKEKMHRYMKEENIYPILTTADIDISKILGNEVVYIQADFNCADSHAIIQQLTQHFHLKKETSFGTGFKIYEFEGRK